METVIFLLHFIAIILYSGIGFIFSLIVEKLEIEDKSEIDLLSRLVLLFFWPFWFIAYLLIGLDLFKKSKSDWS